MKHRNALNILPYKKFDESSSDISLAKSFNEAYLSAILNKAFHIKRKMESLLNKKASL